MVIKSRILHEIAQIFHSVLLMGARACLNIVFLTEKDTFEGRIIIFKQALNNC